MRRSLAAILLLAAGAVLAQALPADLARVVPLLPAPQRQAIQAHARQWAAWSPAERRAFAERARAWDALAPAVRAERRAAWAAWLALPPVERAQLRAAAAREALLDPATRQALRAQFDALDASERHGWRLGPVLGVDYPRLQPLLAQVPADERDGLLRALRAMTPAERERLATLVWRTPPQGRDALRRELASTSDANRSGWLALRLER